MIKIKRHLPNIILIFILLLVIFFHGAYAGYTKNVSVNISGTVVGPNCTANTIDVDFGEVALNTISEGSTRATGVSSKKFSIDLNCKGNVTDTTDVQYKFIGTVSAFNSYSLATNISGLGVIIANLGGSQVGNILPNTWYAFDLASSSHNMIALLVRDPSGTFAGGDFSANATLAIQLP